MEKLCESGAFPYVQVYIAEVTIKYMLEEANEVKLMRNVYDCVVAFSRFFQADPVEPTEELTAALKKAYPDKEELTAEQVDITTIRNFSLF